MKKPFRLPQSSTLFMAFGLISMPAWSQTAADIVVTASRTSETVNESLAAVTVISREQIVRSGARTVQDLLAGVPGVTVTKAGGMGKDSSVFLRGTESDHVLVLVDGVRLGSATAGTAALNYIPLSQIERVEVVRGPRSSLYGAEAVGGVIQIFTRREGSAMRSEMQVGSNSTTQLSQSFSVATETTQAHMTASLLDTQGINAQKDSQPDRDGYDNQSVSAAVEHHWNEQWRGGASFLRAQGENHYDNNFDPLETVLLDEFVQQVANGHLGFAASQDLDLRMQLSHSRDQSANFKNGQPDGDFTTNRYLGSLQGDYQVLPSHLLTLGVDYADDRVDSNTEFQQDSRSNVGTFTQWQAQQGPVEWQLSARYDDNESVGSQTTWNAATGYWFTSAFKAYAAYGTAFKAPTFNELFYPDVGFFKGNPDLKVEESSSWELGLKGSLGTGRWALSYFQNDVDNLITYDAAQSTSVNVGEAEMRGVEADLMTTWNNWRTEFALTYLEAEDKATRKDLSRRPTWSGRMAVGYGWEQYIANLAVRAQSNSYNDARNAQKIGGFAVVDTGVTWLPAQHWSLKAEVQNLLDKEYELLSGYNTEDRTYWLTLAYEK